ncbi:Retention in endoplasmic reticulum 1-like protein [Spraguea lophii 42_110]|uniref:Protein RER1 n=1 Tax=Spraguea lophii (strain 42_110) TaxID=1358809 RepID=S7W7I6_SPRLO|nr:Retention in endoplasmic reticulum 1-like protein [Spraguea lophii 42_110]
MELTTLFNHYLDKITPKRLERWIGFTLLEIFFLLRIYILNSHHLVTYIVSVYLLHSLVMFLTPRDESIPDPFEEFDEYEEYIPQTVDDEFRPFLRRLPEFDFWCRSMGLILFAWFTTFFSFFNITVYVPILILYFIFMIFLTAHKMYKHIKKYHYNPFFGDKEQYGKK